LFGEPVEQFVNERPSQQYLFTTLGLLTTALLLALIYPRGYQGGFPLLEGFGFGVLLGLLVALPYAFFVYARAEVPFAELLIPVVWNTASWGLTGIAIALVYGRSARARKSVRPEPLPQIDIDATDDDPGPPEAPENVSDVEPAADSRSARGRSPDAKEGGTSETFPG
jgi:hypothetical protein